MFILYRNQLTDFKYKSLDWCYEFFLKQVFEQTIATYVT